MGRFEPAHNPHHNRRLRGAALAAPRPQLHAPAVQSTRLAAALVSRSSGTINSTAAQRAESVLYLQHVVGNAIVSRRLKQSGHLAAPSRTAIQRFGAKEHREIGEQATNLKYIRLGSKAS